MPRIFTIAGGILILLLGLSISLVVFSFLAVFGGIAFAYYWWKTREIRKVMRTHMETQMREAQMHHSESAENANGITIDGEWKTDPAANSSAEK